MDGAAVVGEGAERRDQDDRLRQIHVLPPALHIPGILLFYRHT